MTGDGELFAPHRFSEAIERIARRRSGTFSAAGLQERGVCLATIHNQRQSVARLLVNDLLASRLEESPGRMYIVKRNGKPRRLYDFSLVELILHDVVANWLAEKGATHLSPYLYSYRAGVSYHRAVREFARYVRRSCRSSDPHRNGLYVMRRDVRAYFDSIPVHDDAPLWTSLAELIGPARADSLSWALVRRAIRPSLRDAAGATYRLSYGIPTGSPVANVVANLYLRRMDSDLSGLGGGFYARYGDDILAAHPDPSSAASACRILDAHLRTTQMECSAEKTCDLYLTVPGRAADTQVNARPASGVEFLGHRIGADGTISLSLRKTRALLTSLRLSAANAARIEAPNFHVRVGRAVRAINRLLDPHNAAAHPYATLLRTTITDRGYLGWLDHELALIALEAAYGRRSVHHFRAFPPRTLRAEFRLRSLVVARNRAGRRS